MLTRNDILAWVAEVRPSPSTIADIRAEALMLSWIHWDDISRMNLEQMHKIKPTKEDVPVTYACRTCAVCLLYDCSVCPLCFTSEYTSEYADCCGGTWKMFHAAYKKWSASRGSDMPCDWLAILRTAALDVRNAIGSVIDG